MRALPGILCLALLLQCSRISDVRVDGGVSETTNGITVSAVYTDGSPATGCLVRLRQQSYLSALPQMSARAARLEVDTLTDHRGRVHIQGMHPGSYRIELTDRQGSGVAFACTLADTTDHAILHDTLKTTGAIAGRLYPAIGQPVYVRIFGLETVSSVDLLDGSFLIGDLPPGRFRLQFMVASSNLEAAVVDSVVVHPGDTTRLDDLTLFRHSRRLTIDPGTDLSLPVTDFAALIRLTRDNFDFDAARPDGGDVRLYDHAGRLLAAEFERFDADGGLAELWVRIDTIHPFGSIQYLTLCWGARALSQPPRRVAVFDTAAGFAAVWHMNQTGNTLCPDATPNSLHGTPIGMSPASAVMGMIGGAQYFDGTASRIHIEGSAQGPLDFPSNGTYTISAWVYADAFSNLGYLIAGKGHEQYYLKVMYHEVLQTWCFEKVEYQDMTGWQITENPATHGTWKHVTGVQDGATQYLYIDGSLVTNLSRIVSGTAPLNRAEDFSIGAYLRYITYLTEEGFCFWNGRIDEVRVCRTARSAAWIRLCYRNQGPDNSLIIFD